LTLQMKNISDIYQNKSGGESIKTKRFIQQFYQGFCLKFAPMGYIPGWGHAEGMTGYLNANNIHIFDFSNH